MTNEEAIKILSHTTNLGDGILVEAWEGYTTREIKMALDKAIKALGARPQGEWIIIDNTVCECPRCKHQQTFLLSPKESYVNFCERCGADMRGKEVCFQ